MRIDSVGFKNSYSPNTQKANYQVSNNFLKENNINNQSDISFKGFFSIFSKFSKAKNVNPPTNNADIFENFVKLTKLKEKAYMHNVKIKSDDTCTSLEKRINKAINKYEKSPKKFDTLDTNAEYTDPGIPYILYTK